MLKSLNNMSFFPLLTLGFILIPFGELCSIVQAESRITSYLVAEKSKIVRWQPPEGTGSPGPRTTSAGRRGDSSCDLVSVVPDEIEGRLGVEKPVWHVYVKNVADAAIQASDEADYQMSVKFYYYDSVARKRNVLFEDSFSTVPETGMIAIPLPEDVFLERGITYKWELTADCNSMSKAVPLKGALSLEPELISDELLATLATATPIEKAEIYMGQGWWYDAVFILREILAVDESNLEALALWEELLTAEDLEDLLK